MASRRKRETERDYSEPAAVLPEHLRQALEHFAEGLHCMAKVWHHVERESVVAMQPAAFDIKRAAQYLGIGTTKLREYVRDGELPKPTPVGGRPKHLRKHLDALLTKLEKRHRTKGAD